MNLAKLIAEGLPKEIQIVLGWPIDTQQLLLSLPEDKFLAWSQDLVTVLERSGITIEILESLRGQLTRASSIVPLSRHFL